jgi:hypothetical protein
VTQWPVAVAACAVCVILQLSPWQHESTLVVVPLEAMLLDAAALHNAEPLAPPAHIELNQPVPPGVVDMVTGGN